MKWRLGNSYAFWEKSMNPYVVSDMRHYLPDTEKQLTLRVAWKFKFGHQRKSASQRIENSGGESAVFYCWNVHSSNSESRRLGEDAENIVFICNEKIIKAWI